MTKASSRLRRQPSPDKPQIEHSDGVPLNVLQPAGGGPALLIESLPATGRFTVGERVAVPVADGQWFVREVKRIDRTCVTVDLVDAIGTRFGKESVRRVVCEMPPPEKWVRVAPA